MQVIDNILTHEEHKELKEFFHSSHCPWHFNERANQFFDDNFYFTQLLFDNQTFTTPWSEKYIKQLLKKITWAFRAGKGRRNVGIRCTLSEIPL